MQSKESRACEAVGYLGRLRRAMPMQVYIYICWHLELSGNANLRLYQCWFAFTHRSPIKNFASCRLREKNFASLRLRKNLVELRARLSLLVDKTTFQYSVLTIYYTTIGGHAPTSARSRGGRGRHGRAQITTSTARRGRRGRLGRYGITTRGRSRGRMGRARISTPPPPPWRKGKGGAVPDHPQRQHAAEEGTPRTFRIIPSASTPRRKGRPGRAGSRQHPTPENKKEAGTCPPAFCVFLILIFI